MYFSYRGTQLSVPSCYHSVSLLIGHLVTALKGVVKFVVIDKVLFQRYQQMTIPQQ